MQAVAFENEVRACAAGVLGAQEAAAVALAARRALEQHLNPPEVGDAEGEVARKMRGTLDELHNLQRLANPGVDLDEWTNDEILALDIGYGQPGPLERDEIQEQAEERLNEFPLCVEVTMTFEIILGTGGPDDRLLVECAVIRGSRVDTSGAAGMLSIRRVLYRSWERSAERELAGEDRRTAELFARRVVPELSE